MAVGKVIHLGVVSLWHRLTNWIRGLFLRTRKRLVAPAPWGNRIVELDDELRASLAKLHIEAGVVRDTVKNAIADFFDLRDVLAANSQHHYDIVDEVTLLADARATVYSIIERAQGVESLINLAARRRGAKEEREAAGEAILRLRDDARALANVATTALSWASTHSSDDQAAFSACSEILAKLHQPGRPR